jgi:hypothetical protein
MKKVFSVIVVSMLVLMAGVSFAGVNPITNTPDYNGT